MRRVALLLGVCALFAGGLTAAFAATPQAKKPPCKPKTAKKCKKPPARKKTTTAKTTTATTSTGTVPAPKGGFASGVYYALPNASGNATLKLIGGSAPNVTIGTTNGFDVGQVLVWAQGSQLHVVQPNGAEKVLVPDGLYDIRHPSLSPDGKFVAVQATQTSPEEGGDNQWQTVYVINLADGTWRLLEPTGSMPYDGNDLPVWLPTGNEIAYESTEVTNGQDCVVVNVADANTGTVKRTLRRDNGCETPVSVFFEGPRVQMAASADATKLLLVGTLQVIDAQSGAVVASLQDKALAGLQAAGYTPDDRYAGRAGSSPFALAGSFSPDGTKIVFDGAVEKNFHYYQLVMQISLDGTGFKILDGPFEADEPFVAGNTYSLLNTVWNN